MNTRALAALAALLAVQTGCEGEPEAPAGCKPANMVGGVCAGVPNDPICAEDYCTQGVECTAVHQVANANDLGAAIGSAAPGDCIALAPGAYPLAMLPDGVSLLGKGADFVRLSGVETGGPGVRIRGLTVESGSVVVRESGSVSIEGVRISGSELDGITAGTGSTVSVTTSEIRGTGRYGVSAFNVAELSMERTVVDGRDGIAGPGVWAECIGGCACDVSTSATLRDVKLTGNTIVGLSLVGTTAHLENVEVSHTKVGKGFQAGGGISASACSNLTGSRVSILHSDDFGLLLDDSGMKLGELDVRENLRGVWIQKIGMSMQASAIIDSGNIIDNEGVGIGVAGGSTAVTVRNTFIGNTRNITLPVLKNGISADAEEVGDGLTWKGVSQLSLESVTISGSARASLLIDGAVGTGSSIARLTLTGGDEALGILQQNLEAGGEQPAVQESPPVTAVMNEQFSVPEDIAIPPTI